MSKKKKKRLRRLLLVLLVLLMVYSGWRVLSALQQYREAEESYAALAESVVKPYAAKDAAESPAEPEREEEEEEEVLWAEHPPIAVDAETLQEENVDYRGWLYGEGTVINYPVYQDEANTKYAHALPDLSYSFAGSLFMDCRSDAEFRDRRTVIYGHAMDNGTMFGPIWRYRNNGYWSEHDTLYLLTPRRNYRLDVLALINAPPDDALYVNAASDAELQEFITESRANSLLPPMHEGATYKKVCCLSTCTSAANVRIVLVCGMTAIG